GSVNTFYALQNTTAASLNGRLTLLDTDGALVSYLYLSIPANQKVSTNTAALAVARNRTGSARFVHDGPPGAVAVEADIANFSISPAYVQPVRFQAVRETR